MSFSPKRRAPARRPRYLRAALLKQQVVPVRRPRVQDPVLPLLARRHELLPVRNACVVEQLLGLIEVADAELPGQYPVGTSRGEALVPLDAEFDRSVAEREEVRVLGAFIGHPKPEAEVEIPFGSQV